MKLDKNLVVNSKFPENKDKKHYNNFPHEEEQKEKNFFACKLSEFCKRTDLHGYKYIVMEDLNFCERLFWFLSLVFSICLATFLVLTAYRWFARNPIITVIESTHGAIWDVPFPAITICSLNLISKRAAMAFVKSNLTLPYNVNADDLLKMIRLSPTILTGYSIEDSSAKELSLLQSVLELNHITVEDFFIQLSPASSCDNLISRCMWKNTVYHCSQIFQQILTQIYVCCSFNYLAVTNQTLKLAFQHGNKVETPRHIASCGYQTALTVLLKFDFEDYYSVAMASQGALVIIDTAYNIPTPDSPIRLVTPSTEVLVALSPELTYATPGIKSFSPDDRQCYYKDEVVLGNLQEYSYHNCIELKEAQIIKQLCECCPFYISFKEHYRTCNFNDIVCLRKAYQLVTTRNKVTDDLGKPFHCLPECEHYDYPMEIAMGILSNTAQLLGFEFFNSEPLVNQSIVNVFFNDLVSTRYRRDVYLNWENILASFGGLLSLLLGFTLVSGFDVILFFTFRVSYDAWFKYIGEMRTNRIYVRETDATKKSIYLQKY